MKSWLRIMLVVAVAGLWAGAGSAFFAPPALAGGVDPGNNGLLSAAIYNVTPYTWTLVAAHAPANPPGNSLGSGGWNTSPASTIQPGGGTLYRLNPWQTLTPGICFGYNEYNFDAYITYRVDVLGGPPEYANLVIWGPWNQNYCLNGGKWTDPGFAVYFTSSPPPSNYDAWNASGGAPSAQIPNSQLGYAHNVPYLYDQTFEAVGNWTFDATSNPTSGAMADVLNSLCVGATNTTCSFTQQGPLTWGIGNPGSPYAATNCKAGTGGQSSSGKGLGDEPNYFLVAYEASQSASLTVGGGITVGTEFKLFDVIGNEISVSIEAEHEWEETKKFTRESKVYIPANDIAFLWVVPVVGKVTGTLVVSNATATYTITNFSETRSGVSKDALTPAFNVITKVRPMTPAELKIHCGFSTPSSSLGASQGKPPVTSQGKAPLKPVPGQGVARVKLGQTPAQVVQALGQPSAKRFLVNPCQGLDPRCYAVAGTGGRWAYRQLVVVFGPDLRVSGLIYSGAQRSSKGVGVGSGLAVVRGAYPGVSCTGGIAKPRYCTLQGALAGRAVKTVFRFTKTRTGRYKCDQLLIYLIDNRGGKVSS